MPKVILSDDHHIVRQGLRALLESEPDFTVVGEAADGVETVQLVERLKPDVLVVDVVMSGLNGLEVTRQVKDRAPETHVVVLSMHDNEAYVLEALRAGAEAYVLKDATSRELTDAIHQVLDGRHYLSSSLSERAIEVYVRQAQESPLEKYETLTAREREVLHLTAEGHTSAEIAERLHISPRTVDTHRANMMRKLDLSSQTDLIRYAIQRGIIPLED